MTEQEIKREKQLETSLSYGRGISPQAWKELIELRKKSLIQRGEDPDDFDLGSRYLMRKNRAS